MKNITTTVQTAVSQPNVRWRPLHHHGFAVAVSLKNVLVNPPVGALGTEA